MTHRIELFFFEPLLNMTNRVEVFFSMTQRIEPFFFAWLTELNLFFLELWLIELNLFKWLIEWNLFLWLIELNPSLWLIELNVFLSMIQRIEFFFWVWPNRIFFEAKKTHRIEPFFSPTEVNPSFQYDAKNWTFLVFQHDSKNWIFFWLTQKKMNRISRIWLKELRTNFVKNDSKNWTFSGRMTQRSEPCVKRKDSKSGTSLYSEVKNCFFSFSTWLEELNLFFNMSQWIEPFFFFLNMTHRIEPFSIWLKEFWTFQKLWLTELNLFCKKKWLKECFEKK